MKPLLSNIKLFIQRMQKSEEHARWGFDRLLNEPDFEEFFDHLNDAGLFSSKPSQNSPSINGSTIIPLENALTYLKAVAKRADEIPDEKLIKKVMHIIRETVNDSYTTTNYRINQTFAEIFGLISTSQIQLSDLTLIPIWLKNANGTLIGNIIDKGILQKVLESPLQEDLHKAKSILYACTALSCGDEHDQVCKSKRPKTILEDYQLTRLINNHAKAFGVKLPVEAADIFIKRIHTLIEHDGYDLPSWAWRPAIADHAQNQSQSGPGNRYVEGLREILLSWVDHDPKTAIPYIKAILQNQPEIIRRIAIYIMSMRWEILNCIFLDVVSSSIFEVSNQHELYNLLSTNFRMFNDEEKKATLNAIKDLSSSSENDKRLRYIQRNWLSAIEGKGCKFVDEWFQELLSDDTLGPMPPHPEFHMYIESFSGPGTTPYSISEIIGFSENQTLVAKINNFNEIDPWRGPTINALVEALENAVEVGFQQMLSGLPEFINAKRPYQYGIISGFKRAWEKTDKNLHEWNSAWHALIKFFEDLLATESFWTEAVVLDSNFTPNKEWIPPIVAEFLRSGTLNDARAYPQTLLSRGLSLIERLLRNLPSINVLKNDAMFDSINTSRGKAIEALFSHTLRECRLSDIHLGNHKKIWAQIKPLFDQELSKCENNNYEFSTLAGSYIHNLDYIDSEWLEESINKLFSPQFTQNFACALEGFAYSPANPKIYAMLRDNDVLEIALKENPKGHHSRERLLERIVLALLQGQEELDSSLFSVLFDLGVEKDFQTVCRFFLKIQKDEITLRQREQIFAFWERCIDLSQTKSIVNLLSEFSRLACYIETVGNREKKLLLTTASHINNDMDSSEFIFELYRLAEIDPLVISEALNKLLKSHRLKSDLNGNFLLLLEKLTRLGLQDKALVFANDLRHLTGIPEFFENLSKPKKEKF